MLQDCFLNMAPTSVSLVPLNPSPDLAEVAVPGPLDRGDAAGGGGRAQGGGVALVLEQEVDTVCTYVRICVEGSRLHTVRIFVKA